MKYKVGDRVRITDNDCFNSVLRVGDIGTVKKTVGNNVYIDFANAQNQWTRDGDNDIELVTREVKSIHAYDLMKLAAENPQKYEGKKYKVIDNLMDSTGKLHKGAKVEDGQLLADCGEYRFAHINSLTRLEEIIEDKQVSFMEAVNSGKDIKPSNKLDGEWGFEDAKGWLRRLSGNGLMGSKFTQYINGTWIIKGGE